jgi:hypothetical protein
MFTMARVAAICLASFSIGSCGVMNYIHDPQFGLLNRSEVTSLLKSLRCELITFYEANRQTRNTFYSIVVPPDQSLAEAIASAKTAKAGKDAEKAQVAILVAREQRDSARASAVELYPYFPLADGLDWYDSLNLLSGVYAELKVVDSLGMPASGTNTTTIDRKAARSPISSKTLHIGPSLTGMNTYDLNWSFILEQSAELYETKLNETKPNETKSSADLFQCYTELPPIKPWNYAADYVALALPAMEKVVRDHPDPPPPPGPPSDQGKARIEHLTYSIKKSLLMPKDFIGLADGSFPDATQFKRILVDGTLPLAGWLLNHTTEMWTSFAAAIKEAESERLIPAQILFTFSVQGTAGLDARFFEVTPQWNPLAADISGSIAQTGQIIFALNGLDSAIAAGAKTGTSASKGPAGTAPALNSLTLLRTGNGNQHYLLYPLPLTPP